MYVCMYVCMCVAYNNDVYVKQNKCSQTLLLTHQTALHNTSQWKKSSLPCRYVAPP